MDINKTYRECKALYVSDEELKYFHIFLSDNFANINYRVKCNDDASIVFTNLEELLSYENPDFRKIICIEIICDNEDITKEFYRPFIAFKNYFQISLGSEYSSRTLSYTFNFNEINKANGFERELKLRLKGIIPWYWFLSKFDFVLGISLFFFLISVVTVSISIYEKIRFPNNFHNQLDLNINEYIILSVIGAGLIYAIAFPLNKLKKYLFPNTLIELGRQKKKNKLRLQVIYLILSAVFLGLALNILGAFIYELLKSI